MNVHIYIEATKGSQSILNSVLPIVFVQLHIVNIWNLIKTVLWMYLMVVCVCEVVCEVHILLISMNQNRGMLYNLPPPTCDDTTEVSSSKRWKKSDWEGDGSKGCQQVTKIIFNDISRVFEHFGIGRFWQPFLGNIFNGSAHFTTFITSSKSQIRQFVTAKQQFSPAVLLWKQITRPVYRLKSIC